MEEFFTWQMLLTLSGASMGTWLVTQLIKDFIPIMTQAVSYAVALIILLAATFFAGNGSFADYALCILNAVIVSSAASNVAALAQRVKG